MTENSQLKNELIASLGVELAKLLQEDFKDHWSFETKQMLKYMPIVERIIDAQ